MTAGEQTGVLPVRQDARGLYAGFWRRVLAYILDVLIVDIVMTFIGVIAALAVGKTSEEWAPYFMGWAWIMALLLYWLYFAIFESSKLQATPGKLALGLSVTDVRSRRIGFGRATGRYFAKFLSSLILGIGYMMAGWTSRKQALHDMIAGTCVVRREGLETLRASGYSGAPPINPTPGWVVAFAGIGAGVGGIAIIAILASIAIPTYLSFVARAQANEAITLLVDTTNAMIKEYSGKDAWPAAIRDVDPAASRVPVGHYTLALRLVDCRQQVCGIEATMRKESYVNPRIAGKTIEIWTRDGGQSWHCGPGSSSPIDSSFLPANCRSWGAP